MDRQPHCLYPAGSAGRAVHPNAPAGGCGPGPSRLPGLAVGVASLHAPGVGSPAARHANWQDLPEAHFAAVYGRFRPRIAAAKDVPTLVRIAGELAETRQKFEQRGLLRKPPPGDAEVMETLKSVITGPMNLVQEIVFSTAWEVAEKGVDEGVVDACQEAAVAVLKEILEHWFGEFMTAAAVAIKDRDMGSLLDACKAAAEGIAKSLSDRDGLLRAVLRQARRGGLIADKSIEYALHRWLAKVAERVAHIVGAVVDSPLVAAVRILLTPSSTVDERGDLYFTFKDLSDELQERLRVLAPPPPYKADYGALLKNRPGPSVSAPR